MGLRELLAELEELPPGCDMVDVDKMFRLSGHEICIDQQEDTIVYFKHEWESVWTFPRSTQKVPHSLLLAIIAKIRWHSEQDGVL